jgi:hypothetical protein
MLVIATLCVLSLRCSGTGYVLVGSYQRNHGQSFPEAHWICDDTAPKRQRFVPLMSPSDSVDEAL